MSEMSRCFLGNRGQEPWEVEVGGHVGAKGETVALERVCKCAPLRKATFFVTYRYHSRNRPNATDSPNRTPSRHPNHWLLANFQSLTFSLRDPQSPKIGFSLDSPRQKPRRLEGFQTIQSHGILEFWRYPCGSRNSNSEVSDLRIRRGGASKCLQN